MIFDFIKNHEKIFPIEEMCQVLEVSSSGYYRYKSKKISIRLQRTKVVKEKNSHLFSDQTTLWKSQNDY
jgi:putative transposase